MKTIILISSIALAICSCTKEETASTDSNGESTAIPYPLEVCIISGEKLGSMGDPIIIIHEGQEIKFCCDQCIPKFREDPAKHLTKLPKK